MTKKLQFQDFTPEDRTKFLGLSHDYEPLEEVVERANAWAGSNSIHLVSVETLLLPGEVRSTASTATQVEIGSSVSISQWFQAIRIWYTIE